VCGLASEASGREDDSPEKTPGQWDTGQMPQASPLQHLRVPRLSRPRIFAHFVLILYRKREHFVPQARQTQANNNEYLTTRIVTALHL